MIGGNQSENLLESYSSLQRNNFRWAYHIMVTVMEAGMTF